MKEFQDRNKVKKRMYSKTTLLFLFLGTILVFRGAYDVYQKEVESRKEMERVLTQKKELQGRLGNIEHHAELLKTPAGVENEIRNKFDVVKEGEGVIVIVDKEISVLEEDTRGVVRKFFDSVVNVFR